MAFCMHRVARRAFPPAAAASAAAAAWTFSPEDGGGPGARPHTRGTAGGRGWAPWAARCEAPVPPKPKAPYKPADPAGPEADLVLLSDDDKERQSPTSGGAGDELYHGLFPRRQLWRPTVEYPLWDPNWDGRQPIPPGPSAGGADDPKEAERAREARRKREREIRKKGVTRHVILVRHGQYSEVDQRKLQEDSKRLLTPLGREQAARTGKRLGELVRGANKEFGPCRVKVVRVSDLARAKETADIICDNMELDALDGDAVERVAPDPLLNEGRPCHTIPGGKARPSAVERHDDQHARIERAFRKYFFRADLPALLAEGEGSGAGETPNAEKPTAVVATSPEDATPGNDETVPKLAPHPQHEFEIIVCHGNVIRYFFCRALQLPPEAWLRLCTFNCSLTYFTIRPTGTVSCRLLGDIGHLPYGMCTFSMHSGFNW